MSWLANGLNPPSGPLSPGLDEHPKVPDGTGRMVSTKAANRPFLAHREWREKEEARKKAKAERKKERAEKLARGEEVGPEESDEDEEIGLWGFIKFLIYLVIFVLLASKFVTGDWLWEYRGKWTNIKSYIPANQRVFSEKMLASFDGTDPDRPIYIAIDSTVYDVTSSRRIYGKGGSYNLMAGVDATRAYGTGCFGDHRTHDLRGLTEHELKGVNHWIKFFAEHKKYFKVGTVLHDPIDPDSPIPKPCKPPSEQKAETIVGPKEKHEEL